MKKYIKLAIVLGLLILLVQTFGASAQESPEQECPEGSYNIGIEKNGEVICKLNPTGCPYGDSIPLGPECDKFKPVEETVVDSTPQVLADQDQQEDYSDITGK